APYTSLYINEVVTLIIGVTTFTLTGRRYLLAAHQPVNLTRTTLRAGLLGSQNVDLAVRVLAERQDELVELTVEHELPATGLVGCRHEQLACGRRERLTPVAEDVVTGQVRDGGAAVHVAARDRDATLLYLDSLCHVRVSVGEDRLDELFTH